MNSRQNKVFTRDVLCVVLTIVVVVESLLPFVRGDIDRTAWTDDPPSSARPPSHREHGNSDPVPRKDSLLLKALSEQRQVFETKLPTDTDQNSNIVRDGDHVMNIRARTEAGQDNLPKNAQVLKVESGNVKSDIANNTSGETDSGKQVDVRKNNKLLSVLTSTPDENRRSSQDLLQKPGAGASLKQEGQGSATNTMSRFKDMESPSHGDGEHVESESADVKIIDTLNAAADDQLNEEIVDILRRVPGVAVVLGLGDPQKRMRKFLEEIIGGKEHLGGVGDRKIVTNDELAQQNTNIQGLNEIMGNMENLQDKTEMLKFFRDGLFLPKLEDVVREHLPENNMKALPDKFEAAGVNNGISLLSGVRSKREENHQIGGGAVQGESTALPRPGDKQGRVQSPGRPRDGLRIGYFILTNSNQIKESKEIGLSDLRDVNVTGSVRKINRKYPVKCNHLPGAHVPDYGHHQDKTPMPDLGLQGDGTRHHEDPHLLGNEHSHVVQNGAQSNMGTSGDGHPITSGDGHPITSGDGHPITSGDPQGLDSKKEPSLKKGIEQSIIEILSLKAKVEDNAKTVDKKGELLEFYQGQGQQSARELRRHHHVSSVSATHILLIMAICVFTFVTVMYLSSRFRSDSDSTKRVNSQTALFEQQTKYDKY